MTRRQEEKNARPRSRADTPKASNDALQPVLARNEDIARSFDEVADILECENSSNLAPSGRSSTH